MGLQTKRRHYGLSDNRGVVISAWIDGQVRKYGHHISISIPISPPGRIDSLICYFKIKYYINYIWLICTSALADFMQVVYPGWIHLEFRDVFAEVRKKAKYPEKSPRNKARPHLTQSWDRTQASLVGSGFSQCHHCSPILASLSYL